jgi:hypothetical protein
MEVAMTAHSTTLFSAAVIGLSLANPPDARADLCFRYGSGGGTLVAKDATLPKEGTCQPLALFENTDPGSRIGAANGMICRDNTDGRTVIFHYTYDACIGPGSYFESATCRLQLNNANDLPTVSGFCRGMVSGGSGSNLPLGSLFDGSPKLDNCVGVNTTVPGGGGGQCFAGERFSPRQFDKGRSPDTRRDQ